MTVDGLAQGIRVLADDPARRTGMGRAARVSMECRGFDQALRQTWDLYLA